MVEIGGNDGDDEVWVDGGERVESTEVTGWEHPEGGEGLTRSPMKEEDRLLIIHITRDKCRKIIDPRNE
ncbi:hypothetical protein ACFXTH_000958 [Malus domestica]